MANNKNSRLEKYEKRRKNTKFITYFTIIAAVLVLFLIGRWIFGGGDNQTLEKQNSNENEDYFIEVEEDESAANDEDENSESEEKKNDSEQEDNNENDEENDVITEEAEPSDDNVEEAFTGNWQPSGTEQNGPHTTVYTDGSQDRIEINHAVSNATGIASEDMVEWFIENGGDQKVIATVSDKAETETYRVYLSWVDDEGWQPTKIETLITNDKKRN